MVHLNRQKEAKKAKDHKSCIKKIQRKIPVFNENRTIAWYLIHAE